jgi:hypothetical protein
VALASALALTLAVALPPQYQIYPPNRAAGLGVLVALVNVAYLISLRDTRCLP